MQQAIKSTRVATPDGLRPASVIFNEGRIVSVDDHSAVPAGIDVLDMGNLMILPGLVDSHIHINDPGREDWEGFETATRAAAAGGYTCLIDMPLNSMPATTNVQALQEKLHSARGRSLVDYGFWGGCVHGNADQLLSLAHAGVRGFKCFMVPSGVDEFEMVTEADLEKAMPVIAQTGLPLLVHAEHPEPIEAARLGQSGDAREYLNYLRSRPDEAETQAIRILIRLCRQTGCRVHIVHLASAQALGDLRSARAEGLPITVETCPHYLYFSAEQIPAGATEFKCAPPVRDAANRELLWKALREGVIDLIATDHSPCPPAMKKFELGDFFVAWGGIASLSVSLSAVWTAARRRGFDIMDIVRWMCERPAALAGLSMRKGRIAPGLDADFAVFDPDAEFEVTLSRLHFRHLITPYLGERLRGEVKATFVRGQQVYREGEFAREANGCVQ